MLIKTNEVTPSGKELYQDVKTGVVATLNETVFTSSMRRTMRHMNDKRKTNNRKSHGEMVSQFINGKVILHFTKGALARKEAFNKFWRKYT